jgi:hypothetical protein
MNCKSFALKSYRIPPYITFVNWAAAVILGSLFIPMTELFEGKPNFRFDEEFFSVAGMFAAISACLSLPAIIIMLISNIILNKRNVTKLNYLLIQNAVHVAVTILTFAVIGKYEGFASDSFLIPIALVYFTAGTLAWMMSFVIFKEVKTDLKMAENESVIDKI